MFSAPSFTDQPQEHRLSPPPSESNQHAPTLRGLEHRRLGNVLSIEANQTR
ncbi:hypothetical protein BaRGS_00038880, partial [Batillaria attramentaria]